MFHYHVYICCQSFTGRPLDISGVCVLSGCGNLWGDKDFWYIIVCYVYVDSMFVSGGGGGGVDPHACGGRGCPSHSSQCFSECISEWGLFVYLAFRGVGGSGVGLSGVLCLCASSLVAL